MLKLHPVTADKFSNILVLSLLHSASAYSPAIFEKPTPHIWCTNNTVNKLYLWETGTIYCVCHGAKWECVSSDWRSSI